MHQSANINVVYKPIHSLFARFNSKTNQQSSVYNFTPVQKPNIYMYIHLNPIEFTFFTVKLYSQIFQV